MLVDPGEKGLVRSGRGESVYRDVLFMYRKSVTMSIEKTISVKSNLSTRLWAGKRPLLPPGLRRP
jgi:hypothetical protein